jgi:RluA family pseudouridine synthase
MKTLKAQVKSPDDGQRLDVFLAAQGLGLSRRKIRSVIDVGGVYVNQKRVRIASWAVRSGDVVRVEYSEAGLASLKAHRIELKPEALLLRRDGVIAIDKPPGLPSQATKDQSVQHVVPALRALLESLGQKHGQLVLVHRLDKETSGVLLVAEGGARATWLTDLFRARKVKKTYLAVCYGRPARAELTESSPLSEIDKRTGDVRAVRAGGRPAVTHVRVLARAEQHNLCLVECRPETGRSHQIRVHLELNGLPIVGDKRYGAAARTPLPPALADLAAEHQLLHAAAIELPLAEGQTPTRIAAPPPPRFAELCRQAGLTLPESASGRP